MYFSKQRNIQYHMVKSVVLIKHIITSRVQNKYQIKQYTTVIQNYEYSTASYNSAPYYIHKTTEV
jgi:hypothetical protein